MVGWFRVIQQKKPSVPHLCLARRPEKREYSFSFDRSVTSSSGKQNPCYPSAGPREWVAPGACTREGSVRDDIAMPVGSAKRASERPVSHYYRVYGRSKTDPLGFWGDAAEEIEWYEKAKKVDPSIGRPGQPLAAARPHRFAGYRSRREKIGPVRAFKIAITVSRLPKTRSGNGTMKKIADHDPWTIPAPSTIRPLSIRSARPWRNMESDSRFTLRRPRSERGWRIIRQMYISAFQPPK